MGYIPYNPADGEYHDPSGKSINFISPLPIDQCAGALRHYAFNVWRDGDRLRVESITPAEYVLESFAASRYHQKILEGRLITRESGGTWVHAAAIPRPEYAGLLVLVVGLGVMIGLGFIAEGTKPQDILPLVPTIASLGFFVISIARSQAQQAKSVLADIQRSLDTGESSS